MLQFLVVIPHSVISSVEVESGHISLYTTLTRDGTTTLTRGGQQSLYQPSGQLLIKTFLLSELDLTEIISAAAAVSLSPQVWLQDPPASPTQHPEVRVPLLPARRSVSVSAWPGPPAPHLSPLPRLPEQLLLLPPAPPLGVPELQPALQPGAG